MTPDAPYRPQTVHRLHPSSLLFSFLGHVKRYFVPLVVVLLFTRKDGWELWFALLVIPAMVYETYRYLSLRYRFEPDELVITDGVIWRNERHIPLARIQNIDISQGPLQRLFGVAQVSIETASGAEPEAVLRVMALPMIEDMRRAVFGRADLAARDAPRPPDDPADATAAERDAAAPGAERADERAPRELLRLTTGDLLRLGLNPGRGIGLVFVVLGLAWEYELFEDLELSGPVESALADSPVGLAVAVAMGLALVVVAALLALSVAWHVVRLHDFRLERQAGGFRVAYGLFTRHIATIPRERIQFLTVSESPLHRLMGRVSMKVETAGGTEASAESRQWFAPLVRRRELPALLREVHPALLLDHRLEFHAGAGAAWRPLAPRARVRMLKIATFVSVAVAAVCALAFRPWGGLALLIVLPVAVRQAVVESRFLGWARPRWGMAFRSGAWYRKWGLTFDGKIQVVSCHESPFDRRYGMVTLRVDTAGAGGSGQKLHVPYLLRDTAAELRRELADAAERAEFHWAG